MLDFLCLKTGENENRHKDRTEGKSGRIPPFKPFVLRVLAPLLSCPRNFDSEPKNAIPTTSLTLNHSRRDPPSACSPGMSPSIRVESRACPTTRISSIVMRIIIQERLYPLTTLTDVKDTAQVLLDNAYGCMRKLEFYSGA